ncbi:lysoplasmalogenase [Pseudoxanthomonas gei]|uniref:Lysoplasmalogenase n=1 Tax=Pseudoxanthomonas gei TaxID=1383030 RepID=A0ABX0AD29_9GAMM|nr:lysoplasmalogenase [Pseudoxanthomonas gei]NDK38793.1 lysoplasmalogenase [Pseudoxanthomonas gei]
MTALRPGLTLGITIAAACAIAAALAGSAWAWLHFLAKPLATLLLLVLASTAASPVSPRYRATILLGLFFSLVGDVCLMLPADLFLPGLVAFLLAHLCYIAAFAPGSDARTRLACIALFAVFGGVNLYGLLPRLPADMRVPVLVYVAALVVMAGLALARSRSLRNAGAQPGLAGSARAAAIGAALFVLSDTLLAWNRFGGGIPLASLWVLATYYVAQWYIARSVDLHTGGQ